jgi:hypothetical protein
MDSGLPRRLRLLAMTAGHQPTNHLRTTLPRPMVSAACAWSSCCGLWPRFHTSRPTRNRPNVHLLLPPGQVFVEFKPSRRQATMPHRISAFVLAVLATSLAVAAELGTQGPASATGECLEKFGSGSDQAGHWYYHTDRVNNRKCWFFEPAEAPPASTAPPPPNGGAEESWFSQFTTSVQQTFLGTQDPPVGSTAPGVNSTKLSANTPKQRSRPAPPPETHRAPGSGLQISPEDRDALFQEFLRRYELEKSIHADPRP